jgi:hypothetical protein
MALPLAPKSTYTAPAGVTQFIDFPHLSWTQDTGVTTVNIRVGRRHLLSNMVSPWLKTTATGATDPETIQACLEIACQTITLTGGLLVPAVIDVICDVTLEFQGPMDPALNPLKSKPRPSIDFEVVEEKK